jgi:NAD dependent epimerase/dehydratase family enzyme
VINAERVLLAGASGLIGTSVIRRLVEERISIISLVRRPPKSAGGPEVLWDPYSVTPVSDLRPLDGTTAAVQLSGVNVAGGRWSAAYKREIIESRVKPTHAMATLLAGLRPKPAVLVCASAIGIYGGRGDEWLTEASLPGTGFLPEVCLAWEKATQPAIEAGIRVVQ